MLNKLYLSLPALDPYVSYERLIIGEYRGISLYRCVYHQGAPGRERFNDSATSDEELILLAKMYVDAALSLLPDLDPVGCNASYCKTHLEYLQEEFEEEDTFYGVFFPLNSKRDLHIDESRYVDGASYEAMARDIAEFEEGKQFEMTPQVQALLLFE